MLYKMFGKGRGISIMNAHEENLLSMDFIGKDQDGRFTFRFKDNPGQVFTGDQSDYQEWRLAQERYFITPIPDVYAEPWRR